MSTPIPTPLAELLAGLLRAIDEALTLPHVALPREAGRRARLMEDRADAVRATAERLLHPGADLAFETARLRAFVDDRQPTYDPLCERCAHPICACCPTCGWPPNHALNEQCTEVEEAAR